MTSVEQGRTLLAIARAAIAEHLGFSGSVENDDEWLLEPGATFVTLTRHGQLRGCIGSLQAYRPLVEDVRANAVAAAFRDPRFAPMLADEFTDVRVEVSLLTPAQPLIFSDEADALRQLRPNVDGVILQFGSSRSTFLPQVWEQLPQPSEFMAHLKHKAGLPVDFWQQGIRLSRYSVEKWKE